MHTKRRALLRAVVGAAAVMGVAAPGLAGCDLFTPDPPPPPDPLTDFHQQTLALAALYESGPIRDAHLEHAAALAQVMKPPPPSGSPVPPSPRPSTAPASLREAEQAAWQLAMRTCLAAPAERATLLGEIAAARACHVEALA